MSEDLEIVGSKRHDENTATFLIRWRGRQEGPYTTTAIEEKLTTNQIGLLHEISHNGQWVTLREYFTEREAISRAERDAAEEQERRLREDNERQARLKEERHRAKSLAEERRKNDLPTIHKPHRGGTILALGLIGLFLFPPLCIAAWIMGDSDLREMNAGLMDDSGRSSTAAGRTAGAVGTILWILSAIAYFLI